MLWIIPKNMRIDDLEEKLQAKIENHELDIMASFPFLSDNEKELEN